MARTSVDQRQVGPETLSDSLRNYRYGFEPFAQQPFSFTLTDGFGDPTGTAGNQNAFFTGRNTLVWHVLGTQDILVPVFTTDGYYNFGLDQTLADGWELLFGGTEGVTTGGNVSTHYTVGTHDCFFRLRFAAEDISGANLIVGFRKVEAFQADYEDYDELAGIQTLGASGTATGAINIVSILNDAATSSTSTGDTTADTTDYEFLVKVDSDGAVTFAIDGAPPSTTATFTFDDGEIIQPFVHFLNTTDVVGELKLQRAEWGLLADLPLSTILVP